LERIGARAVESGSLADELIMAFQRKKPAAIGVKAAYPGFIEPALASSIEKVPTGDRWIHEIKFDGYRVQAAPDHGEVLGVADAADHGGAHGDGFGSDI
jgi:ATP-dependent DNA ligase